MRSRKTFRDKKIPVDALYLDIDYQDKNTPFTINRKEFPTFEKKYTDLKRAGVSYRADHGFTHQERS